MAPPLRLQPLEQLPLQLSVLPPLLLPLELRQLQHQRVGCLEALHRREVYLALQHLPLVHRPLEDPPSLELQLQQPLHKLLNNKFQLKLLCRLIWMRLKDKKRNASGRRWSD